MDPVRIDENPLNVKISLQSASENKIQEISYDGQETFIHPLTMSQSLTDLANRIDFLEEDAEKMSQTEEEEAKEMEEKQWPWENIHTHLKRALTEMNVLVDVMSIAQNKLANQQKEASDPGQYLMFDLAQDEPEPQTKPVLKMLTKKRCLNAASKILLDGAKRLNEAKSELSTQNTFHLQLLRLRQRWRVRRVGEKILGDLSYRSTGSDFWHSGAFEVIKKSLDEEVEDDSGNDEATKSIISLVPALRPPLQVVVSADLKGVATITVSIIDITSKTLRSSSVRNTDFYLKKSGNEPSWHRKLCNAQNVLFCKELFARLTKEAVQHKAYGINSPFVVIENTISTRIFPHTKLEIKLVHSKTSHPASQTSDGDNSSIFSLKHALMHHLVKFHSKRLNIEPPHPTSAALGLTNELRHASVQGSPVRYLAKHARRNGISFIEPMIKMAKHHEVQHRLNEVILRIAKEFSDPYVQAHWSTVSDMYQTTVRVMLVNSGYESCHKSNMLLTAHPGEIRVIQREGMVLSLPIESTKIYHYLLTQICNHQLLTIQSLAQTLGWTLLNLSPNCGVGNDNSLHSKGTLIIAEPSGTKNVSVSCSLDVNNAIRYEINVQHPRSLDSWAEDDKYASLGGKWRKVVWKDVEGRYFVNKMETLLTCLNSK